MDDRPIDLLYDTDTNRPSPFSTFPLDIFVSSVSLASVAFILMFFDVGSSGLFCIAKPAGYHGHSLHVRVVWVVRVLAYI